jgi:hypothetical protein
MYERGRWTEERVPIRRKGGRSRFGRFGDDGAEDSGEYENEMMSWKARQQLQGRQHPEVGRVWSRDFEDRTAMGGQEHGDEGTAWKARQQPQARHHQEVGRVRNPQRNDLRR